MIAMALIAGPRFLIADEATTALDPKTQEDILDLLQGLREKRGLAILFITHDLALAKRRADQLLVMQKGEIVPENSPYARRLFRAGLLNTKPKTIIEVL
jgi:ABC-type dipeptide/oligopeptide/nickel transport system ATPase component